MSHETAIIQYRGQLHFLAQKIVGSMHDAEDIVQDTFEKWLTIDIKKITCPRSYLITAVTNNCLNFLDSKKQQMLKKAHDIYDYASASMDNHSYKEILNFDFNTELEHALHVVQHRLEPLERSVFMLREVFGINYDELQAIFEVKHDYLRKLFSRAKQKVRQNTSIKRPSFNLPNFQPSFQLACKKGILSDLISDMKKEVKKIQKK